MDSSEARSPCTTAHSGSLQSDLPSVSLTNNNSPPAPEKGHSTSRRSRARTLSRTAVSSELVRSRATTNGDNHLHYTSCCSSRGRRGSVGIGVGNGGRRLEGVGCSRGLEHGRGRTRKDEDGRGEVERRRGHGGRKGQTWGGQAQGVGRVLDWLEARADVAMSLLFSVLYYYHCAFVLLLYTCTHPLCHICSA